MSINFATLAEGVRQHVDSIIVTVQAATGAKSDGSRDSFRTCVGKKTGHTFIAMNGTNQRGQVFDIEIMSPGGFVGDLVDDDTGTVVEFEPPRIGEKVRLTGAIAKLAPYLGLPKVKLTLQSALQIERNPLIVGASAPAKGRRKKAV